jgi:hypothetical protein
VRFLQHRPVLSNAKLLRDFGMPLRKTAREAFVHFLDAQGLGAGR